MTRRPIGGHRSEVAGLPHVVISLTSIPVRFSRLHETIDSLLGQDYPHLSLELYLSRDYPPRELSTLQATLKGRIVETGAPDAAASSAAFSSSRLAIVLVDDVGPATKFIYAPRRHPESLIAICDDDQVYHPSWLATLVEWNRTLENRACVGFSGPIREESFQANPALRPLGDLPYPDKDGRIVARKIVTDQTLYDDPVQILWPQGYTGYLLPSGVEKQSPLAEHYSRCMSEIPRAYLEDMKTDSGTTTCIPDDPVIGSYHHVLGLDVLAVPRGFSQRELDTARMDALGSRQHEYELKHGESMSTTVYRALRESGLL